MNFINLTSGNNLNGLVQDYSNFSVLAMESLQSCPKPSILLWLIFTNILLTKNFLLTNALFIEVLALKKCNLYTQWL